MRCLLLALALFGLALAADDYKEEGYGHKVEYGHEKSYGQEKSYGHEDKSYGHEEKSYGHGYEGYSKQVYHGKYPGKCSNDGFYYNNEYSFVICSNGNSYEQQCAPGSRNSGYDHFSYGNTYYARDFCDVNLVDYGYGAAKGYGHQEPSYGYDQGYGGHRDAGYGYDKGYQGNDGYGYGSRAGYGGHPGYGGHRGGAGYGYRSYGHGRNAY